MSFRRRNRNVPSADTGGHYNSQLNAIGCNILANTIARSITSKSSLDDSQYLSILKDVSSMIQAQTPASLYPDWAPPTSPPLSVLSRTDYEISTSSNDSEHKLDDIFDLTGSKMWMSEKQEEESTIDVIFHRSVTMGAINFMFGSSANASLEVDLFVAPVTETSKEEGITWSRYGMVDVETVPTSKKQLSPHNILLYGLKCRGIRIVLKGHSKKNLQRQHAISALSLFEMIPVSIPPGSSSLLSSLEEFILMTASSHKDDISQAALKCCFELSNATGALSAQIIVARALLVCSQKLCPKVAINCFAHMRTLATLCAPEQAKSSASSTSTTEEGSGCFELQGSSSGNITNDGKTIRSTAGGCVACLDVGISKGKLIWEFQLDVDDEESQCSCFGLAVKPVTNLNYESSQQMWMWRAYNGYLYVKGSQNGTISKIRVHDTVRFELDMDEGVCRASVNGDDKGIVFENLVEEGTIYPAVQFYSSNRQVSILSVQVPSSGLRIGQKPPMSASIATDSLVLTDTQPHKDGLPPGNHSHVSDSYLPFPFTAGQNDIHGVWEVKEAENQMLRAVVALSFGSQSQTSTVETNAEKTGIDTIAHQLYSQFQPEYEQPQDSVLLYFELKSDKSENVIWTSHAFPISEDIVEQCKQPSNSRPFALLPEKLCVAIPDHTTKLTLRVRSNNLLPFAVYPVWISPRLVPMTSSTAQEDNWLSQLGYWCNSGIASKQRKAFISILEQSKQLATRNHNDLDTHMRLANLQKHLQMPAFYATMSLSMLASKSKQLLQTFDTMQPALPVNGPGYSLEQPFVLQATGRCFYVLLGLLQHLIDHLSISRAEQHVRLLGQCLCIIRTNMRYLKCTGVNLVDAHIEPLTNDTWIVPDTQFTTASSNYDRFEWVSIRSLIDQLESTGSSIENFVLDNGTKLKGPSHAALRSIAAECFDLVDDWWSMSGESAATRMAAQFSNMTVGDIAIEFQFAWYKSTEENSSGADMRVDRLALLLQSAARQHRWQCHIYAVWNKTLHVIINIPSSSTSDDDSTNLESITSPRFKHLYQFLTIQLATIFENASCGTWQFPGGCSEPEISVKRERALRQQSSIIADEAGVSSIMGAGVVRLYTKDVASYSSLQNMLDEYSNAYSAGYETAILEKTAASMALEAKQREATSQVSASVTDPTMISLDTIVSEEDDIAFFTDSDSD